MADFNTALPVLFTLEFSNNPKLALEQVPGEDFITWCGITRRDEGDFPGWSIIDQYITKYNGITKDCSAEAYSNKDLLAMTAKFYKAKYWDIAKLDEIVSQHTAEEIFTTGVLCGVKIGIKLAQKVAGVTDDGVMGPKSIAAINSCDVSFFDKAFDDAEITRYKMLVEKNPKFQMYLKGWTNRAYLV